MAKHGASGTQPRVTIVGAGLAGMTAALRLLDAGFDVTVFESGDHCGGKFDAVRDEGFPHEHAYHFLADWCVNFWDVAQRIGLRRSERPGEPTDFAKRDVIRFLTPGADIPIPARLSKLGHGASLLRFWENIGEAPIPPDDMIAYVTSLLDLVLSGPDESHREFLNRVPVNGFMRSLGYMTDLAALLHQEALAKAFAIPSYETSVRSYRTFVRYFGRDNGGWILNGPVDRTFWEPFKRTLRAGPFALHCRRRVESIEVAPTGHDLGEVQAVWVTDPSGCHRVAVSNLIVTVPHGALATLVERSPGLRILAEDLLEVRKLRSRQMASLDLHLARRLPGVPPDHVTLISDRLMHADRERRPSLLAQNSGLESTYGLSFVDNLQAWPQERRQWPSEMWLNVVAADFEPLAGLRPATAEAEIISELQRYLPFDRRDIRRAHFRPNADAPLFMNTVGSWQARPETRLDPRHRGLRVWDRIPNLFLAGDYCRSDIDLVCLEGAVATAINAACALADRLCRPMSPPKLPPEVSPEDCARAKIELEPWLDAVAKHPGRRAVGREDATG